LKHRVAGEEPNISEEHTALLFDPEDGSDMFLQNIRLSLNYMALQPRKPLFKLYDICLQRK
jgi:hypothetical protein